MMKKIFLFLSVTMICEAKTVFWFTGLPCSGKTTIAQAICENHPDYVHLDGDEIRKSITKPLGYSMEDRKKNLETIAQLALSKLETAETVLVTTISPLESQRETVRKSIEVGGARFYIIYVQTDLDTCIQRDVKGMYAKALKGEIENFTGISSPYEPPLIPDLVFETTKETLDEIKLKFQHFRKQLP